MKTALIAGSTGLIGKQLLTLLLASPRYGKVIALSRHPLEIKSEKLKVIITDLQSLQDHQQELIADDVFCCLGTTMAKAKTKEKFYEVDFTYPLALARLSHKNGAKQFMLVSAMGADKNSSIFYNKVKGEIEEAIAQIGFENYSVFRPSLLFGERTERRPGESLAKVAFKIFGFLIPSQYKGIEGSDVAKAMLHYAALDQKGKHIHYSEQIRYKFSS